QPAGNQDGDGVTEQEGGIIGTVPGYEVDSVMVVETNIDDMNPEVYGFVMDRLFDGGALDVTLTPVYMKKGRPGSILQVICEAGMEKEMADIMLKETSTIGVRSCRADRLKLPRKTIEVQTRFGEVRMKVARSPWGEKAQPEYDDCKKIAMETGVPILEVYAEAIKGFERNSYE
ncbi:MAG: nickel insertion protein, partial [Deltaproteobacteria bacterium]